MKTVITEQTSKKIVAYQILFSIMVVFIHAYNLVIFGITKSGVFSTICYYLERIMYYFTAVAVPGFYFFSGYLFYATLTRSNFIKKYKKRVFSLLFPYIIWNTLVFLFWITIEKIPMLSQHFTNQHMWSFSMDSIIKCFTMPINAPMWFMRNLFIVLIIAPIIWKIIKKKWGGAIFLCVILFINILLKSDKYAIVYDVFLFSFGGYIVYNWNQEFQTSSKKATVVSCVILLTFLLVCFLFPEMELDSYGLQIVADVALFFCFWFAGGFIHWSNVSFSHIVASIRTFTYFSHSVLLESFEKVVLLFLGKNVYAALFDYIFAPIIIISFLWLVSLTLSKYTPRLWKVLNGFR